MRGLLAVLLVALLPAPALPAPARDHERGERTVTSLEPELLLWGGFYSGAFGAVSGIYCDPRNGEIYVLDRGSGAIEIFDENGAPLFAFSDPEHLREPARVAVDDQGRIHVIDNDKTRIKVFNYRGEFERDLELPGFPPAEQPTFTALTFDANGDLYVGESRSGQVVAFDRKLQPKLRVGTYGEGPGQLSGIVGIALDEKNIYVASQDGIAVHVFSRQGRFQRGWGRHDTGLHNVSLPSGIAVDDRGRVILLDLLRQEIKYFDPDGRLIELFGGWGRQPGAVAFPSDLSMDRKGRLCVADGGNRRAQVLSPVNADAAPAKPKELEPPPDAAPEDAAPRGAAPARGVEPKPRD
jgi:DNA-binding beta-propeller fold protein YncE